MRSTPLVWTCDIELRGTAGLLPEKKIDRLVDALIETAWCDWVPDLNERFEGIDLQILVQALTNRAIERCG